MSTVLASDQTAIAYVEGEAPKIRPVRPADAPALALFFRGLSQESRYRRFHAGISGIAPTCSSDSPIPIPGTNWRSLQWPMSRTASLRR